MLHWLRAQNVALLKDVSLEFGEGLNVVTGETGVGKSVLLESLGLVLGGRGRSQLVGSAGDRAVVEAGFFLDEGESSSQGERFRAMCDEVGIPFEDGEIVVRRELRLAPGRRTASNRVAVNGAAVPVAALRVLGTLLAEVYGQGEYLALLQPGAAREAVDAAAGHRDLRRSVAAAYRNLREAESEREGLEHHLRDAEFQRAAMERALREIERAAPEPGEMASLQAERRILGDAERLSGCLDTAYRALHGSNDAASTQLAIAFRALGDAAAVDPEIGRLLEGRADLLVEVEDLADAVRKRWDRVRAAPERLSEIEDRLAVLRSLERRHGGGRGGADGLLARASELRGVLDGLEDRAEEQGRAVKAAAEGAARYRELAASLGESRRRAAEVLSSRVRDELVELGIPRARLTIRIEPLRERVENQGDHRKDEPRQEAHDSRPDPATRHYAEHGLDRLEFLFSAGPEMAPAPIGDVASGGESSRFFLALKAAGAGQGGAATLIFDEADVGTSGRIADAVGRRMRRLAASRQVVSVTHLPQVAALGRTHLVVEKLESGDAIRVRGLTGRARIEEIARMLAGPEVTASAREHACALLDGAAFESPRGRDGAPPARPAGG